LRLQALVLADLVDLESGQGHAAPHRNSGIAAGVIVLMFLRKPNWLRRRAKRTARPLSSFRSTRMASALTRAAALISRSTHLSNSCGLWHARYQTIFRPTTTVISTFNLPFWPGCWHSQCALAY